ncbi:hypothetical protein BMR1_03g04222 [Babesia microti strain RI]|uniref:Uncharacterized protein n=1 Tax=Babesia microti (strain RI) TaxID=1133968 RepID=A0A1R4ACB5_BABMR|nr:hypothetical protein BMR1_03g04222 [Babesia microti strain RI]SJK86652.1 hypothetical protein BMR1_03g04222 [Babesia microti strain RI]|eukprot:XP_021338783.1 hypothetical protein BMR1_03g04222 [Babesia microti strain RI]
MECLSDPPAQAGAANQTELYVKFGETYYSEEVVPHDFTWYASDGTLRRYVKDFLLYNPKGERLLRLEIELKSLGLYGISNDYSGLENAILFAKAHNMAQVHSYSELVHANHPSLARCTGPQAKSAGRAKVPKPHRSFSLRAIIHEWFIDYAEERQGQAFLWVISRNDIFYRLEAPAGRYASAFSNFSIKSDIIRQFMGAYLSTDRPLVNVAQDYLEANEDKLLCNDHTNTELANQILVFLLSEIKYFQLIPRHKTLMGKDVTTLINCVPGSELALRHKLRLSKVPDAPPVRPPKRRARQRPAPAGRLGLYEQLPRREFPPEYQHQHMLLPQDFDYDAYSTHTEYEEAMRGQSQLPLVDEAHLRLDNRLYFRRDLPLRSLAPYPAPDILDLWQFLRSYRPFLRLPYLPTLPALEATLLSDPSTGPVDPPDHPEWGRLRLESSSLCTSVKELIFSQADSQGLDQVVKSLDMFALPHPLLPCIIGRLVSLYIPSTRVEIECREIPGLSKQDAEMCEEILTSVDGTDKKWLRRFRRVLRLLAVAPQEGEIQIVIDRPHVQEKIPLSQLYPDLTHAHKPLQLVDQDLQIEYEGLLEADIPPHTLTECIWPLLLRRHLFLVSHKLRRVYTFTDGEVVQGAYVDTWEPSANGNPHRHFSLNWPRLSLSDKLKLLLELASKAIQSPQAQAYIAECVSRGASTPSGGSAPTTPSAASTPEVKAKEGGSKAKGEGSEPKREGSEPKGEGSEPKEGGSKAKGGGSEAKQGRSKAKEGKSELNQGVVGARPPQGKGGGKRAERVANSDEFHLRAELLGEDRFFNRYIYFGEAAGCNRVFVQFLPREGVPDKWLDRPVLPSGGPAPATPSAASAPEVKAKGEGSEPMEGKPEANQEKPEVNQGVVGAGPPLGGQTQRVRRKVVRMDAGFESNRKRAKEDASLGLADLHPTALKAKPHRRPRLLESLAFFCRMPTHFDSTDDYDEFIRVLAPRMRYGYIGGGAHAKKFVARLCHRSLREKALAGRLDRVAALLDKPLDMCYVWPSVLAAQVWCLTLHLLSFERELLAKIGRADSCRGLAAEILCDVLLRGGPAPTTPCTASVQEARGGGSEEKEGGAEVNRENPEPNREKPEVNQGVVGAGPPLAITGKMCMLLRRLHDALLALHERYRGLGILKEEWDHTRWEMELETVPHIMPTLSVEAVAVFALFWRRVERNLGDLEWLRSTLPISPFGRTEPLDDPSVLTPGSRVFVFTTPLAAPAEAYGTHGAGAAADLQGCGALEFATVLRAWKVRTPAEDAASAGHYYAILIRTSPLDVHEFIAGVFPELEDEEKSTRASGLYEMVGEILTQHDKTRSKSECSVAQCSTTGAAPQPVQRELLIRLPQGIDQCVISLDKMKCSLAGRWRRSMKFRFSDVIHKDCEKFTGFISRIDYAAVDPWLNVHVEWDRPKPGHPVLGRDRLNIWQLAPAKASHKRELCDDTG